MLASILTQVRGHGTLESVTPFDTELECTEVEAARLQLSPVSGAGQGCRPLTCSPRNPPSLEAHSGGG